MDNMIKLGCDKHDGTDIKLASTELLNEIVNCKECRDIDDKINTTQLGNHQTRLDKHFQLIKVLILANNQKEERITALEKKINP